MIINHNLNAMNAQRNMSFNTTNAGKAMEKLSSGLRINRAGDDAAGLAISEKMRGQIRGLDQASRNAQDGISLIQTAEGALNETHSILQRMRELSVQSASDTNTDSDRSEIQKEVSQLKEEINRISATTEFNTKKLLNGDLESGSSIAKGTKLNSVVLKTAATQGTVTSQNALAASTAVTASNNTLTLSVDGAGAQTLTLSTDAGYSREELVAEINNQIGSNASLTGKVTAELTADNKLTFRSALSGSSSSVVAGGNFTSAGDSGAAVGTAVSVAGVNSADTVSGTTTLVSLADGNGNNTGLKVGNQINISVVVGGELKTSYIAVAANTTLSDLADTVRDTIGGAASVTIEDNQLKITGQQGEAFAVSNLELGVQKSSTDTTSTAQNFANRLSAYEETQSAKDIKDDKALTLHIGANAGQSVKVDLNEMSVASLSLSSVDVSSQQGADTAVKVIQNALDKVSTERSKLGSVQNRLEHTINNLNVGAENLQAAESRVRDVDMAKEMMNFTKNNILNQAAQAMLAQAKSQPEAVLQLLR